MEDLEFTGERLVPDKVNKNSQLYIEHMTRYDFSRSYVNNKNILDAGCGCGYGSDYLAQYAREVTGIDISCDAVAYCNKHYRRSNLKYCQMDCQYLTFNDSTFDTITSFEVIEHFKDPSCYLKELHRVLKPGGQLIVSTPNDDVYHNDNVNNPFHLFNMDVRGFNDLLKDYFKTIDMFGQRIDPIYKLNSKLFYMQKQIDNVNYKLDHLYSYMFKSLIPALVKENVKTLFRMGEFRNKKNLCNPKNMFDYPMSGDDISIDKEQIEKAAYFIAVCTKV